MRLRWLLLLLVCALPHWAVAADDLQASNPKMKDALHTVIKGQLAAFRAGDYAAAYAFADPSIKTQFPLEAFERMVRTGYPLIAKSASATFGLTFDNGDEAVVAVTVVGENDQTVSYHYLLKRNGDHWNISGVVAAGKPPLEV